MFSIWGLDRGHGKDTSDLSCISVATPMEGGGSVIDAKK